MENYWFNKDDQYILKHCTKYLARASQGASVGPGDFPSSIRLGELLQLLGRGSIEISTSEIHLLRYQCQVTGQRGSDRILCHLSEPIPLRQIVFEDQPTRYRSVTYAVRKGEKHIYRFMVDQAYASMVRSTRKRSSEIMVKVGRASSPMPFRLRW